MSLLGNGRPLQVLRGSIRSLNAISLDRSLSRDGYCADARAAGDGIREAKALAEEHTRRTDNPHGLTKAQLGLGSADNTADLEKPVSEPQAQAIAQAKQEALEAANAARTRADKAQSTADTAHAAGQRAQASAEAAQAAAEAAHSAAETAQTAADGKCSWFSASVTLKKGGWSGQKQRVSVAGVTENADQPVFVTPAEESRDAYRDFGIRSAGQGTDSLIFSCEAVPEEDLLLHIVGFTVPKEVAQ